MSGATAAGHRVILSAPWYLNIISYGNSWEARWLVEPTDFPGSAEQKKLVMGGKVSV